MRPMARWLAFVAFLLLAAAATLPLRFAGLERAGLTASAASGTIWQGKLMSAQWHGIPLGDIAVGLSPTALLGGGLRLDFAGDAIGGTLVKHPGGMRVTGLAGRVGPLQIGGFPITAIEFDGVDIGFTDGTCTAAAGQVRVQPAIRHENLAGTARCAGRVLQLPLASPSGAERFDLDLGADGRYRATLAIDSATETARETERLALLAAGFQPTPRGFMLAMEGSL